MTPRADWRGAILFASFPVPVAAYKRVRRDRGDSFKMIDPKDKLPVNRIYVDHNGDKVEYDDLGRGVVVGEVIHALPPEALEQIERASRSTFVEIERFAPLNTIALDLSLESYVITFDDKVPGSEQSIQTFWNGLKASGRAAVIQDWCPRSGSKPSTLVIYATDEGLIGNIMPFKFEVKPCPSFTPAVDKGAQKMAAMAIDTMYPTGPFDLEAYRDGHAERRQAAIDMALAGEPIPAGEAVPKPAAPDLMQALAAKLEGAGTKPARKAAAKPRAPRTRAKA